MNWQKLSAQNLVPNSSFEIFSNCPQGTGKIYLSTNWFQPRKINNASVSQSSSSEYFNSCTSSLAVSVPNNMFGYQNAKTGNAYIGYSFLSTQIDKTVYKMEAASAEFIDILQEPTK